MLTKPGTADSAGLLGSEDAATFGRADLSARGSDVGLLDSKHATGPSRELLVAAGVTGLLDPEDATGPGFGLSTAAGVDKDEDDKVCGGIVDITDRGPDTQRFRVTALCNWG